MPDARPDVRPDALSAAVPAAVRTGLRSHLTAPRSPQRLYEEVRDRCHGADADVVRRHHVRGDGTCAMCGQPAGGVPGSPCATLLGLAVDLGLHLRLAA